jgi:aspartyl-tRNA(Asn)/glutamyl-tRNA(Gln) amidotransferase subunit C
MAITRQDILKIAGLAKLHFSESELDAFAVQFQRILEYVEKLKELDVASVAPTSHVSSEVPSGMQNIRGDARQESLPAAEALRNAPDPGDDHFRVPKVI